jgi:aminotransferase EvaB
MARNFDYLASLPEIEERLEEAFHRVLHSGRLILGPETEAFEAEFAKFTGASHCVAVSSGTAALHLALWALDIGPGDEVITVANTCPPTVAAIRLTGAEPVFADVRETDLMMDPASAERLIGPATACIIAVHLWGMSVDLDDLGRIAAAHGLPLLEDCAQAHGTRWRAQHVGTFGRAGCFSFYPTKNIGAFGDAGAIITNEPDLAQRLRRIRMYGYEGDPTALEEGTNARVNELQAALLRIKLDVYPSWLERRRRVAGTYDSGLHDRSVRLPRIPSHCEPCHHQYVVRVQQRGALREALLSRGIETAVHYPIPVHRMPAYRHMPGAQATLPVTERAAGEILSLPVHEAVTREQAERVVAAVNELGKATNAR